MKKKKIKIQRLEQRLMLDAAAVAAIVNPILHFDASDIDADGLTNDQPANGAAVGTWNDGAGGTDDVASAGGGNRPTYVENAFDTGLGGLKFDGNDDEFTLGTTGEINNAVFAEKSFAFVFRTGTDIISNQMIYEQGGTTNAITFSIFSGNLYAHQFRGGSAGVHNVINLGSVDANETYRVIAVFDRTTDNTWSANVNGGAFISRSLSADMPGHSGGPGFGGENGTILSPLTGHANATNLFFEGTLGEFWSWNHALTDAEITSVDNYFKAKWVGSLVVDINNTTSVSEADQVAVNSTVLDTTSFNTTDDNILYTITTLTDHGELRNGTTILSASDTFTHQDIIDGNIIYTHDGSENFTDFFTFTVDDGTDSVGATNFNFEIISILDPAEIANTGANTDEGGTVSISDTNLSFDTTNGDTTPWYDTNWQFRQQITVDSTNITADLTDYAILLDSNAVGLDFFNNVKADGSDIVVTLGNGTTVLERELVTINTSANTLQLYARVPTISSITDTNLYIYFGNAAATETNSATTWRNEYTGVWHFDSDFDAPDPQVTDSSQAGNHGYARGGFDSDNQVTGVVGSGAEFNNAEYISLDYSYSGNNTLPQISVSAWINTTVNGASQSGNWAIIDFDRSEFFNFYVHENGQLGFSTAGNGLAIDDFYSGVAHTVNDGAWYHVAAVYDGTDKILYIDGVEVARDVNTHGGAALGKSTRFAFIGDGSEATAFDGGRNNAYFDGMYDNITIYEGALDAATTRAEYINQNDSSMFYARSGDAQSMSDTIEYSVIDLPENGVLKLNGTALAIDDIFTQDDLDNNLISYTHDHSDTVSDSFDFTVRNPLGNERTAYTFSFSINPIDDAPIIPAEPEFFISTDSSSDSGNNDSSGRNADQSNSIPDNGSSGIGLGGSEQIIRKNVSEIIREIQSDADSIQIASPEISLNPNLGIVAGQAVIDSAPAQEVGINSDATKTENYTNIRESIQFLSAMDQSESSQIHESMGNPGSENYNSDDNIGNFSNKFEDVLTYHEQRKAQLKEALLS